MTDANPPWTKQQVKTFVKQVRDTLGNAWEYMTPDVRAAFIKAQILSVIRSQHADTIEIAKIDYLSNAMLREAGLE